MEDISHQRGVMGYFEFQRALARAESPRNSDDYLGLGVSLIIPALNEAEGLKSILPRIPPVVDELLIVDGHSADHTRDVVAALYPTARLITQSGRGKGNALKSGLAVAVGEIIVTMDADGSMRPEDIPAFVNLLRDGCDFVKGSRSLPGAGSDDFTRLRRLGNTGLTRVANAIFQSHYTDLTFGFNGYWRSTISHLGRLADGFEFEIQAAIRAASVGMRTAEVPTYEPARVGGESKLNPVRDGWAILRVILAEASPRRAGRFGPDGAISAGLADATLVANASVAPTASSVAP